MMRVINIGKKTAAAVLAGALFLIGLYFTTNWGRIRSWEITLGMGLTVVSVWMMFWLWQRLPFPDLFNPVFLNEVFYWSAVYLVAILGLPEYPLLTLVVVATAVVFRNVEGPIIFWWQQYRKR